MATQLKATGPQTLYDFGKRLVGEIMETNVQSAHSQTKADVIASRMIEGFGAVPVVDNQQHLIGIVSEHDLLASLNRGQKWADLTAEDVMTRSPYSIRPETTIATLVHVLQASNLIRVPVVDEHDKLIGIVARRDILRAYLAAGVGAKGQG
jgi:CBS domain-containing protein